MVVLINVSIYARDIPCYHPWEHHTYESETQVSPRFSGRFSINFTTIIESGSKIP